MATPIPSNSAEFSLRELVAETAAATHGVPFERVIGVESDTRKDLRGKLYVALEGESFDGHDFVAEAGRNGAAAALVARRVAGLELPQLLVSSPLAALGALARAHRRRWGQRLSCIVGSAGKTTTKAVVGALLEASEPGGVRVTPGNLNNRVGVPMVLLTLAAHHQRAVIEVGTNQRGEVASLARVTEPDVAVLTLVDWEHAQGIGDLDAIEQEEGDMLRALGAEGIAVANGDDTRARRQLERSPARSRITFGFGEGCDYRVAERRVRDMGQVIELQRPTGPGLRIETRLLGYAGAMSWAAGISTAEAMLGEAVTAELVHEAAVALGEGETGRLRPQVLRDGTVVINDSYNSNPVSVHRSIAAAREIAEVRGVRLVLVLGEMRELGEESVAAHRSLARWLQPTDKLVAVSGDMRLLEAEAAARGIAAVGVENAKQAAAAAAEFIAAGDVVLVKGSRSVGLELAVEALVAARGVPG